MKGEQEPRVFGGEGADLYFRVLYAMFARRHICADEFFAASSAKSACQRRDALAQGSQVIGRNGSWSAAAAQCQAARKAR